MKLENWSVVRICDSPYQAPELWTRRLHGNVYGHAAFPEGELVTTSEITTISSSRVHTRSGSVYELGEVDPAYEAAFPNARERLLAEAS